jgi:hypothetical protein
VLGKPIAANVAESNGPVVPIEWIFRDMPISSSVLVELPSPEQVGLNGFCP